MNIPHLSSPFLIDKYPLIGKHLGCSQFVAIIHNAAMHIYVQGFVYIYVFFFSILLGIYLRVELLGHK